MARPFESVKDITDAKDLWKIAVKIHHKWDVISNTKKHFEMVVVDKDGTDIHVVVPPLYFKTFESQLAVNDTVTISNFHVQHNDVVFKPSQHKFLLKFTGGTTVGDRNKHEIPEKLVAVTPFEDLIAGKWKNDVLIDIIGMVDEVGFMWTNPGSRKQQVNLVLKDLSNNLLNCTLWESYAVQFIKFNQSKTDASTPTVIYLRYAKVKEEDVKYPLSVSNTFHVSKLYINDDLKQIKDFMESIPKETLALSSHTQVMSQNSSGSVLTPYQKFMTNAVVLPLANIKLLPTDTVCITVVTIVKLIASQYGWYYQACHQCPKVARGENPPYKCENKHLTETEIYRYKIQVQVVYGEIKCKFVMWDRESEQLLGISAAQMRTRMIEGGVTDPLEYPLALDKLVGQELAFKVKWQPLWDSCSVVSVYEDKVVIKQLKAPWEVDVKPICDALPAPSSVQIKESVDEAINVDEADVVNETEITSKLNPDPVTPTTKRSTPDASSATTKLVNLSDGELSSNKLNKMIKIESDV